MNTTPTPMRWWRRLRTMIALAAVGALAVTLAPPTVASAAALQTADGLSAATAAGSCWEVKQQDGDAPSGIYWLVTPALVAPEQFWCDQETDGGGWVLIGRGREGWKEGYHGLRTPAQLRNTPTGTGAFAPAQLPADTVDALLDGGSVDALTEGIRLRRATNQAGNAWQEVRFHFQHRDRWVWTFGAEHRVGAYSFDGQGSSGGQTNQFGTDNQFRRVVFNEQSSHSYLNGFAFGAQVTGSTSASSYLWAPAGQGYARPFTQVYLRPRLTVAGMDFGTVADSGTPASTIPAIPSSDAMSTVWGVSGFANGSGGELNTEVAAFGEVDGKVFVGGNFRYVQRSSAGADQVEQPFLAAFDVDTGEWVSGFRPTLNGQVKAIIGLPDGRVAIGGQFSQVNGVTQPGLAILDPDTGELSGWQVVAERRTTGGVPYVRGFDIQDDYLYVAGAMTHLTRVGASTSASAWNGGRIRLSTGTPDTNWNAWLNGTSVGVDASSQGDRTYFSGYFKQKQETYTPSAVALQTTAGAPVVAPLWRPTFSNSGVDGDGNVTGNVWQLGVAEAGGKVWLGGSEHSLFSYDRDTFELLGGSITKAGGDFQTVEASGGLVFGGCHCGHWVYQDARRWSGVGTAWTQADKMNLVGAWDAETGLYVPEWSPTLQARAGYGAWATFVDSNSVVWIGGDFSRSVRAGGAAQWSGGYVRFAPHDTTAPSTPGEVDVALTDGGERATLSWGASDESGVVYEVIRENTVIAATTARSLTVDVTDQSTRYFVRARDDAGNRSASTHAARVEPGSDSALTLIQTGEQWAWRFSTDTLANGWTDPDYDDSDWQRGGGLFGLGVPGVATDLNAAGATPRPLSAQFRKEFTVTDAATVVDGQVSVIADDGVVVHVNGVEIGRTRMPNGTIGQNSYATATIRHATASAQRSSFPVPYGLLVDGTNVITASVHANYRNTPDLSFDLSLHAERGEPTLPGEVTELVAEATGADTIALTWAGPGSGPDPTGYVILRDDTEVGTTDDDELTFVDEGLEPDTEYTYTVLATLGAGLTSPPVSVSVRTAQEAEVTLVGVGEEWAWRYSDEAWPEDWTSEEFDDSDWEVGPGLFGVGVSSQSTDLNAAGLSPRPLSAQLRKTFTLTDWDPNGDGTVTVIANDGVVVYLNGVELGRHRLPDGTLTSKTYATGAVSHRTASANPVTFTVPAELLVNGTNVLAVSVHANYRATADLSFDLDLRMPR